MKLHSIRQKLMLTLLLITGTALVIASTVSVYYNLSNYRENTIRDMLSQATLISRATTPALQFGDQQAAQDFVELSGGTVSLQVAALYDASGKIFASHIRQGLDEHTLSALPETDGITIQNHSISLYQRVVANNEILGTLYLQADYDFYEKLLVNLGIALGGTLVALVIALLLSLWLQRSITDPILAVTRHAAEVVEKGNYSLRAEKTSDDEVGTLVDTFNTMLAVVEKSYSALAQSNTKLAREMEERTQAVEAQHQSARQVQVLNAQLEQRVKQRTLQLESANNELEAFSYSVSHDLRSPLRAIDGFSQALLEDYSDQIDEFGQDYLNRIRTAAQRMGMLIDDMLKLSQVSRSEIKVEDVNLSELAEEVVNELREIEPDRNVDMRITSNLVFACDRQLMRIVLQNLLNNAWKYSSKQPESHIEFGMRHHDGEAVFFVQDNGVGFDMKYAGKLFGAFQRLHKAEDFPGTGIGLATVKRIISRHGGNIRAESIPDEGTAFYFTLEMPTMNIKDKHQLEETIDEH